MANKYRVWVDGEVLTAANVTDYLQKGAVIICDSSADYPTAYAREGMTIYDKALDTQLVYTGATWVRTTPVTTTAVQTYAPSWLQGVAVSGTVNENRYIRTGPVVEAWVSLTATTSGTANTEITVSLPVAPSGNFAGSVIGEFAWQDNTSNLWVTGVALVSTGNKANFVGGSGATQAFGKTFALAIGDVFRMHVRYTV
jgi:hypothetical protein